MKTKQELEQNIIIALRTVYDPEIPVNVYDLGLIYEINIDDNNNVNIIMTLTSPNCPEAEMIPVNIKNTIAMIRDLNNIDVKIVFEPTWTKDMMTDEAKLDLGLL